MTLRIQRRNAESGGKVAGEQYTWDVTSPPRGGGRLKEYLESHGAQEWNFQCNLGVCLHTCSLLHDIQEEVLSPRSWSHCLKPCYKQKRFQELLELICLLGFTTETSRKPETSSENKLPQNSLGRNQPLAPRVKKQVAGTAVLGVIQGGGTQMRSALESPAIISSQLSGCPQLSCTFL